MREKYETVSKAHEKSLDNNRTLRSKIDCYRDVLSKLITASEGNSTLPTREKISCLKPLNRGIEIITPNIKARATVYSQQVKGKGMLFVRLGKQKIISKTPLFGHLFLIVH